MPEKRSRETWKLSENGTLTLSRADGRIKTFKAHLLAADANSLTLEAHSRDRRGNDHLRTVRFSGSWQADERNRLSFLAGKDKEQGVLTLKNSWKIGEDQEIVYETQKTRTRRRSAVTLEGHWRLGSAERITYVLGRGKTLDFRCQLESLSLQPKKGAVKFRIGGGVERRAVVIFGSWRFSRGLGIDFEAGSNGRIRFDTGISAGQRHKLFLELRDEKRKPLGVSVGITRDLARDGQAWLKLSGKGRGRSVEAGVKAPF